ncbi:MAG: hypothetical protein C0412_04405 [Flavobacterium sp.]|nr:hypothetical protein [Flavobacterium sp.]
MIENLLKQATCSIKCGNENGTGHLVSKMHVLTACHCIKDSIENSEAIFLTFPVDDKHIEIEASILDVAKEFDVCILLLPSPLKCYPLSLSLEQPRPGSNWQTFGYPNEKQIIGQRISGEVSHVLAAPHARIDIDLTVAQSTKPNSFQGISGSALLVDGTCRGIIRLRTGNTIGAISFTAIKDFLEKNGIYQDEPEKSEDCVATEQEKLADRLNFQNDFESQIAKSDENFFFVGGSHGIGKTTFCNSYIPNNSQILSLGCYPLGSVKFGSDVIVRIQPEIFYDWLSTTISSLLFGKASRKVDLSYSELVTQTSSLFKELSEYCLAKNMTAVLFIDGVNEAQLVDPTSLLKLVGILPKSLPKMIKIIFTAPNFETVSSTLGARVSGSNKITVPPLSEPASQKFCWETILPEKVSHKLVQSICDKGQGHPLYLRYLINYVNQNKSESLDEFPAISGQIEKYYESLWDILIRDQDGLNFLALIARLRWGIEKEKLLSILSSTEQAAFIPTISRIKHLFYDSNTTTIYHPSFAEFLKAKTANLDIIIHGRIADACINGNLSSYGLLNQIYHLLRSKNEDISKAVYKCEQSWVDNCVELGVEPDTLLHDITSALTASIKYGLAEETIRLLLLSQRASFRYNNLFLEHAGLITSALIWLKMPSEAIKHAIRHNNLIIGADRALTASIDLLKGGFKDDAKKILKLLDKCLTESLFKPRINIEDFVLINCKLVAANILLEKISEEKSPMKIPQLVNSYCRVIRDNFDEENGKIADELIAEFNCNFTVLPVLLYKKYLSINEVLEHSELDELPSNYFLTLVLALLDLRQKSLQLAIPIDLKLLNQLFLDLEKLLKDGKEIPFHIASNAIDAFIIMGASDSLIQLASKNSDQSYVKTTNFIASNNVDVDYPRLIHISQDWRRKSYLELDTQYPEIPPLNPQNWIKTFENLVCALAWCDGRARRAKNEKNDDLLSSTFEVLNTKILGTLDFSLSQRAKWTDVYSIPEFLLPFIYQRIVSIFIDCFPNKLLTFLKDLNKKLASQLGLYNEGFRRVLNILVFELTFIKHDKQISEEIFKIIRFWKNYIIGGIENRHELVPELLQLIPYFARLSANEEAKDVFKKVLGLSMGPNWYKEDQLSLMLEAFKHTDCCSEDSGFFSKSAGYLEHCSGEMTFQRYVRQQKHELIAELFRRGKFEEGLKYFIYQSCGPLAHLKNEALYGYIDKTSKFEGMRFPGGGIDEQNAILGIIKNTKELNWRLRWALLEIFQCGDERYLSDFAKEYAEIINKNFEKTGNAQEIIHRLNIVTGTELDTCDLSTFLQSFFENLNEELHNSFEELKEKIFDGEANPIQQSFSSISPSRHENHERNEEIDEDIAKDIDENILFMPGTFGTRDSSIKFKSEIDRAKKELKLGNKVASAKIAANAIKLLQDGGWGIWTSCHSDAHREAEELILQASMNSKDLIGFYSSMIENEQYTETWQIAAHLIPKIIKLSSKKDQTILQNYIFEHFQQLVGNANDEINTYSFLDASHNSDGNQALFALITWLVDHPKRLRREKAIEMLLWLVAPEASFFDVAFQEAFSMKIGYAPDILAGIIDGLSLENPLALWNVAYPILEKNRIISHCGHANRLLILSRIAQRAADLGSKNGKTTLNEISKKIMDRKLKQDEQNNEFYIPYWAECIAYIIQPFYNLGLSICNIITETEVELGKICQPLSISEAFDIENLVSKGFRERTNSYLNRWEAKVRFALNSSLFKLLTEEQLKEIEALIRPYNPSFPRKNLTDYFSIRRFQIPFLDDDINEEVGNLIGNKDHYFLHFFGIIRDAEEQRNLSIETKACYIHSNRLKQMDFPHPDEFQQINSFRRPNLNEIHSDFETCISFIPSPIYGGEISPAIPFPSFSQKIASQNENFKRLSWLINRSSNPYYLGQPKYEGCLLAVEKEKLSIPKDLELVWYIFNNDRFIEIIDLKGNRYRRGA